MPGGNQGRQGRRWEPWRKLAHFVSCMMCWEEPAACRREEARRDIINTFIVSVCGFEGSMQFVIIHTRRTPFVFAVLSFKTNVKLTMIKKWNIN